MPVIRSVITDTSPAAASTVVGPTVTGLDDIREALRINAELVGATGGTLDVYLQWFDGVDWWDLVHFPQLAAGAAAVTYSINIRRSAQSADATGVTIGKNTSPALAANTLAGGDFGDRLRMLFVAGAGTTVGAVQTVTVVGTEELGEAHAERHLAQTSPVA